MKAVQEERQKRSNIVIDENSVKKRACKRYCPKSTNAESEPKIKRGVDEYESEKL